MSIANLLTDLNKPDQNLNVNSIEAYQLGLNGPIYSHDTNGSTTVTATVLTQQGTIVYTDVANIASGTATTVIISLAGFDPLTDNVQITSNYQGIAEQGKLYAFVFFKSTVTGNIIVGIRNVSTTNFTGTEYAFDYLITKNTA